MKKLYQFITKKKDKPKQEFEIPKDAPKVEKEEAKFTRFMLEDRRTNVKDMVDGFVGPDDVIGHYAYTGVTDSDEGGAVITHIYRKLDPSEMSKIPNEAPIHEKPEFNGGVIPNDPPIHEKPEFNGGVIPNDAPVHNKPEFNGGAIPNDSPVHDKPEFNGGVVPNESPIHDKPELKIPEQPVETPIVPETPKSQEKRQEQFVTNELPNTGTEASLLGLVGLATAIGSVGLLKLKKDDSE